MLVVSSAKQELRRARSWHKTPVVQWRIDSGGTSQPLLACMLKVGRVFSAGMQPSVGNFRYDALRLCFSACKFQKRLAVNSILLSATQSSIYMPNCCYSCITLANL